MKVMIPLAEGFEEIEALTVVDVLRRAGMHVDTIGVVGSVIEGSHGIRVMTDKRINQINPNDYDIIVLPGGSPGYQNLARSGIITEILKNFNRQNKMIAAICGAPLILAQIGILENRKATVYPGFERKLPYPRDRPVVVDNNIVTSQAPGTAMEFALKIVELKLGASAAKKLKEELVVA
ncbi:MAG: DJ-1/PfpI family protein [Candidatus Aenigmarchaeota archaeon]|nr:DJ-1/PfpI family protein [Candidatus Aenigmarchaeota archaeon]